MICSPGKPVLLLIAVPVFLRLLEYYTGVLILTTNRPTMLDPAFESRIDITLDYSELTPAARAKVLNNFLETLPQDSVDVTQDDVAALMERHVNGREIKSAVKIARILAQSERSKLKKSHLEVVLGLREKSKGVLAGRS